MTRTDRGVGAIPLSSPKRPPASAPLRGFFCPLGLGSGDMTAKKTVEEWAAIEFDYRNSPSSVRSIARTHRLDPKAVRRRARERGWVRPTKKCPHRGHRPLIVPVFKIPARLEPSSLYRGGLGVLARLLDELDATTSNLGEIEKEIRSSSLEARRASLAQVMSLPMRATALRNLAIALKAFSEAAGSI